jgi:hypothetical protein
MYGFTREVKNASQARVYVGSKETLTVSYNKRDGGRMCVVLSIGKPLYLVTKTVDYGSPS